MRSIYIITLNSIKKRKLQSFLITLIIMVSCVMFFISLGILTKSKEPFIKMQQKLNASQDVIGYKESLYDINKLKTWWENNEGVKSVQTYKGYNYSGKASYNKSPFRYEVSFTEREEGLVQDKLLIVEGDKKETPGAGEVWVPTGIAYQENIKVGGILKVNVNKKDINLKVSAIVVDPQFSSAMINPTRMWIKSGEVDKIFKDVDNNIGSIGVIYKDYSKAEQIWSDFLNSQKEKFKGGILQYSFVEFIYTFLSKLIASILMVLSTIVLAITLLVISFTIKNSIFSDYKTIGVLKAQGLSNTNIKAIYTGQFFILSVIAVVPSLILGKILINALLYSFIRVVGIVNINESMITEIMITILFIVGTVTITSYITAGRAAKIKPAEAIRNGSPSKNYRKNPKINIIYLKALPLSLILAIKQIVTNKKQSVFIFITLVVTVFMITFTINIRHSLIKLSDNLAYWGFDGSEYQVVRSATKGSINHEELFNALKSDKKVKAVVPYYYIEGSYTDAIDSGGIPAKQIGGFGYDGDMDSIGLLNISGKSPKEKNEVSIAINTSRRLKKTVGDYIDMTIAGKGRTFLITGVYQAMINEAEGYRAQKASIIELDPTFDTKVYSVVFKEKSNNSEFIKEFTNRYNDISIEKTKDRNGKIFNDIGKNISVPILMVGVIFIIISFINIFNIVLINIYEERKNYGIYKALGFTIKQIRLSIINRIMTLTALATLIGIILGFTAGPKMIELALSKQGLVEFPFLITTKTTVFGILLFIIIVFAAVWFPTSKLLSINLRELIEE
ncbi:MAG: ABC transporter permease [Clostridium sp.]|uniref:ABC transporter permease n=1 Tax=Clostridium sp. TaxID=1506 RepID=UPI003D6D7ECC